MSTGQISFDSKAMLNINAMKGGEVSLSKGEIVSGVVQQVNEDGLIVINIKGKNIEAYSEVSVQAGQKLYLSVDDVRSGKTYLKVMTPELMEKMETGNIVANLRNMNIMATDTSIMLARKLLQYKLPVNEKNINELARMANALGGINKNNLEISAFVLSRGVNAGSEALNALKNFVNSPTSDSLLRFIQYAAATEGGSGDDAVAILSKQLVQVLQPVLEKNPAALLRATGNDLKSVQNMSTTLPDDEATTPQNSNQPAAKSPVSETVQSPGSSGSGQLTSTSRSGTQVLVQAVVNSPEEFESAPVVYSSEPDGDEQIKNAPANRAIPFEDGAETGVPARGLDGRNNAKPIVIAETPALSTANDSATPSVKAGIETATQTNVASKTNQDDLILQNIKNAELELPDSSSPIFRSEKLLTDLFKALNNNLMLKPDSGTAQLAEDIQARIMGEKNVLTGLDTLKRLLTDDNVQDRLPFAREILRSVDGLERDISGQRLFNLTSRSGTDQTSSVYYFSIPVKYDEQYRMMQLRMSADGSRRAMAEPDHLNIAVSLDTENLGIVIYHVEWFRTGDIKIQGIVENRDIAEYMNADMASLVGNLSEMGYNVSNLGIKVSKTAQDAEDLKPRLVEIEDNIKPFGIDIKV